MRLGEERIYTALFIIKNAPDQIELVLSGLPLRGNKGKAIESIGFSQEGRKREKRKVIGIRWVLINSGFVMLVQCCAIQWN
jgi:hypothetical protein